MLVAAVICYDHQVVAIVAERPRHVRCLKLAGPEKYRDRLPDQYVHVAESLSPRVWQLVDQHAVAFLSTYELFGDANDPHDIIRVRRQPDCRRRRDDIAG